MLKCDMKNNTVSYGDNKEVKLDVLSDFSHKILTTYSEYVYPRVFTDIVNALVDSNVFTYFDDKDLYDLRIWANVYREQYFKFHRYNIEYKIKEIYVNKDFDNEINASVHYVYALALKTIELAKFKHSTNTYEYQH